MGGWMDDLLSGSVNPSATGQPGRWAARGGQGEYGWTHVNVRSALGVEVRLGSYLERGRARLGQCPGSHSQRVEAPSP